jgi:hypothetical protein
MTCFTSRPASFETASLSLRTAGQADCPDPEYFDQLRQERRPNTARTRLAVAFGNDKSGFLGRHELADTFEKVLKPQKIDAAVRMQT